MRLVQYIWAILASAALLTGAAGATEPAKSIFGAQRLPSAGPSQPLGSYAKGCLAGATELPETGPGWQAMRLSRNRNWGHPEMVAFIDRLSRGAAGIGWPRLFVGDVSQPRGGPMNGGHRSHQVGLDADIWLRIPGSEALSTSEREKISSLSVVRADRMGVGNAWHPEHHALIRQAARDPAVARIFVNAAIKRAMCEAEPPGERDWLRKVRAWWGHDSHFHVRLNCPKNSPGCIDQEAPPAGDGCGDELAWWFSDEALNPKPSTKLYVELTLQDLPESCRTTVLQ
ncbi:MAG TPA: penicillin-insensitive murein endopeptidase [Thermohalobaculum sp.]|nr:penicillin-insensitive murein endopeptidase [Thermohalobaculum sp.]